MSTKPSYLRKNDTITHDMTFSFTYTKVQSKTKAKITKLKPRQTNVSADKQKAVQHKLKMISYLHMWCSNGVIELCLSLIFPRLSTLKIFVIVLETERTFPKTTPIGNVCIVFFDDISR